MKVDKDNNGDAQYEIVYPLLFSFLGKYLRRALDIFNIT